MFHWVHDQRISPDNNLTESDLLPTFIARKVSFGSQSKVGARTLTILMTDLISLKKQHPLDYPHRFKVALDFVAANPKADL